jgi:thiol-disulfide isomerase/thioredoxin
MQYTMAIMILVGLVSGLNLLLIFGVIRRLREHERAINRGQRFGGPNAAHKLIIGVGESVGEFSALDVDDVELTHHAVGSSLVAFFSPQCAPCEELLPAFVREAAREPGGRARVVAVVVGEQDHAARLVGELKHVARVVVEQFGGPLTAAFQVRGFPAVVRVSDAGMVAADTYDVAVARRPRLAA